MALELLWAPNSSEDFLPFDSVKAGACRRLGAVGGWGGGWWFGGGAEKSDRSKPIQPTLFHSNPTQTDPMCVSNRSDPLPLTDYPELIDLSNGKRVGGPVNAGAAVASEARA
jgi:hypothetical protein